MLQRLLGPQREGQGVCSQQAVRRHYARSDGVQREGHSWGGSGGR